MLKLGNEKREITLDLLFLVPVALFFLLFNLGNGALASWDESIYAVIAREIVRSGDWMTLTYQGQVWFEKPPLVFWGMGGCFKLFGISEFSARLFPALCGAGAVIAAYFLGRKLFNRAVGFSGALILLSAAHFLKVARFAVTDAPFTFFLTLAFTLFYMGRSRKRYFLLAGIPLGLAVMTKGFLALVFIPITVGFCVFAKEPRILKNVYYWGAFALGAGIALPWFLYEYLHFGSRFSDEILGLHVIERALKVSAGHEGNAYFYIRTFINKFRPWFFIGLVSAPFFIYKAVRERKPEFVFLTCWIVFFFCLITLARTKLPWYILPIYPPLALTMGYLLDKFSRGNRTLVRLVFLAVLVSHIPLSGIFKPDYARDIKGIAPAVREHVPGAEVYLYNYHEDPAVVFYTEKKGVALNDAETFMKRLGEEPSFYCLIRRHNFEELLGRLPPASVRIEGEFENLLLITKS